MLKYRDLHSRLPYFIPVTVSAHDELREAVSTRTEGDGEKTRLLNSTDIELKHLHKRPVQVIDSKVIKIIKSY